MCMFFLLSTTSCEEEESQLRFVTESVSDSDNVKIEYYSPDPCCVPKMYYITANNCASNLTIRCSNASSILFENRGGELSEEYACPEGRWKATLHDSNVITVSFDEVGSEASEEFGPMVIVGFNVVSTGQNGSDRAQMSVMRLLSESGPIL